MKLHCFFAKFSFMLFLAFPAFIVFANNYIYISTAADYLMGVVPKQPKGKKMSRSPPLDGTKNTYASEPLGKKSRKAISPPHTPSFGREISRLTAVGIYIQTICEFCLVFCLPSPSFKCLHSSIFKPLFRLDNNNKIFHSYDGLDSLS